MDLVSDLIDADTRSPSPGARGRILDAAYELNQHRPLGLACGIGAAQIDAMAEWRTSGLFDARQRALLDAEGVPFCGSRVNMRVARIPEQP